MRSVYSFLLTLGTYFRSVAIDRFSQSSSPRSGSAAPLAAGRRTNARPAVKELAPNTLVRQPETDRLPVVPHDVAIEPTLSDAPSGLASSLHGVDPRLGYSCQSHGLAGNLPQSPRHFPWPGRSIALLWGNRRHVSECWRYRQTLRSAESVTAISPAGEIGQVSGDAAPPRRARYQRCGPGMPAREKPSRDRFGAVTDHFRSNPACALPRGGKAPCRPARWQPRRSGY